MKRTLLAGLLGVVVFVFLSQAAWSDEVSDFKKKVDKLVKELLVRRNEYVTANRRFNEIRDPLLKLGKEHPDYGKLVKEHNELYEKMPQLISAVDSARSAVQNEILSFIQGGGRETVEAIRNIVYKGSKKVDVSVERAVSAGLKRITASDAVSFMVEELHNSGYKEWRRILCEALAHRKEDSVVKALVSTLKDRDWEMAVAAAKALARNRSKEAVEPVIAAYERAEDAGKEGAARGMRAALHEMTGQYVLDTARDFRNWWDGSGQKEYSENATAKPRGIIGKDGPHSTLYGEITSKNVIFICDVSHSMSAKGRVPESADGSGKEDDKRPETGGKVMGGKSGKEKLRLGKQGVKPGFVGMRIDILKIELTHVVTNLLPDDAKFNLVTYSGQVYPWKKRLTKASKANRKSALAFVEKMEPIGRTNTHDALELAFSDKSVDTIYFLSDGYPTTGKFVHPEEILAAVRRWNSGRNVTIHTIGLVVGKYMNEEQDRLKSFLKKLAAENGGECRIFEDN